MSGHPGFGRHFFLEVRAQIRQRTLAAQWLNGSADVAAMEHRALPKADPVFLRQEAAQFRFDLVCGLLPSKTEPLADAGYMRVDNNAGDAEDVPENDIALAVLRPTPGNSVRPTISLGTRPPNSLINTSIAPRILRVF